MTTDEAVKRQAAHECLMRELVEALDGAVAAWDRLYSAHALPSAFEDVEFQEMNRARAALARAKEQQQ